MNARLLICTGLVGLLGLAACGRQGSLDRPGPLFGAGSHRAMRNAANRANGEKSPDTSATSQTNGDYSHASDGAKDPALLPLRTDPPPGAPTGPGGGARSGGVLPDPYSDPNRAPR
jgi:hypothetical protein